MIDFFLIAWMRMKSIYHRKKMCIKLKENVCDSSTIKSKIRPYFFFDTSFQINNNVKLAIE